MQRNQLCIKNREGFTLLEVVLAIGLSVTLLALLATAIDLYLVRVDSDRSKVEAAQLARTLMNQIADDIRAVSYYDPDGESSADSQGGSDPNSSSTSGALDSDETSQVQGIFGTATELRIDRSSRWNWLRTAREIDPTEATGQEDMPMTVGYVFNDGERLLTDQLAAMGVPTDAALPGYSGLYRQQTPTPAWLYQANESGVSLSSVAQVEPELLAPEVLSLQFRYFDGEQLLDSWDSAVQEGLPVAIEIRMTVLKEPYDLARDTSSQEREVILQSSENSVEFSLFVMLPSVVTPQSASLAGSGQNTAQQGITGGQGNAGPEGFGGESGT